MCVSSHNTEYSRTLRILDKARPRPTCRPTIAVVQHWPFLYYLRKKHLFLHNVKEKLTNIDKHFRRNSGVNDDCKHLKLCYSSSLKMAEFDRTYTMAAQQCEGDMRKSAVTAIRFTDVHCERKEEPFCFLRSF